MEISGRYVEEDFAFTRWVLVIPEARICPDHVPPDVARIFGEASSCAAIGAWDAAGAMFRKVLDAATRERTPEPIRDDPTTPPNWKTYKDLRLRLDWLFANGLLDRSLEDLSSCIHQDGNDAAHALEGIGEAEASDLAEFTDVVLRTIYSVPGQIAENQRRRAERRGGSR
jgi:hypothetical protein